jgi:hypothetical protein
MRYYNIVAMSNVMIYNQAGLVCVVRDICYLHFISLHLTALIPMPWSGWGTHVDISMPPGGNGGVPNWAELKFNPLGLYNLRCRLGALSREPGMFMRYKDRFLHSDIAWFASGLHTDGQHITS